MFFNVGLVLLAAWLLGSVGVYTLERVHVLLLGSLMFFLFALLERRDAPVTRSDTRPREAASSDRDLGAVARSASRRHD
jgi:hypothetical protein